MGTWALFSTSYCTNTSSCVLVDAWVQLALSVFALLFLVLLALAGCRGCRAHVNGSAMGAVGDGTGRTRRSGSREAVGTNGAGAGAGAGFGHRFLDTLLPVRRGRGMFRTAPLPMAVIQNDANAAKVRGHKNSTKHAAAFMQQTQRMIRMDLARQPTLANTAGGAATGHQTNDSSADEESGVAALTTTGTTPTSSNMPATPGRSISERITRFSLLNRRTSRPSETTGSHDVRPGSRSRSGSGPAPAPGPGTSPRDPVLGESNATHPRRRRRQRSLDNMVVPQGTSPLLLLQSATGVSDSSELDAGTPDRMPPPTESYDKQSSFRTPAPDTSAPGPGGAAARLRIWSRVSSGHRKKSNELMASGDDEGESTPGVQTGSGKTSLRLRLTSAMHPRRVTREPSAAAFDEPNYKKRQRLAELSPERRTRQERQASVVLRDKRRLSVGTNALLQFYVDGSRDGDAGHVASVYEVKLKEIQLVKRLAFGPLSEVYAAVWRDTQVGVKLLMPRDGVVDRLEDAVRNFRREIWVMQALVHPNIVKLIGASLTPTCYVLVMEYMANGSLYEYLRDSDNFFPNQMILTSALDIAEGMAHIHQAGVLQRDLKSKNCLVSENLVVKVADFGLARFKAPSPRESSTESNASVVTPAPEYTFVGTPFWAAPEVIRHEAYDEKADVYSFAIVLWELVQRCDPYDGLNSFQVPYMVANDGLRPAPFAPHLTPPLGLEHLMTQCWDSNPDQRPTFDEIADTLHMWLRPPPADEDEDVDELASHTAGGGDGVEGEDAMTELGTEKRSNVHDDDGEDEDEDGALSIHIKRGRYTVSEQELHRFASSHSVHAKVIPIKLSRGLSERFPLQRQREAEALVPSMDLNGTF